MHLLEQAGCYGASGCRSLSVYPPRSSLSSKEQVRTIANQGREGTETREAWPRNNSADLGQGPSVQCSHSVVSNSLLDCSMPDFLFHHQLPEFTQTHVHWVSDAIQPPHPLPSLLLLPLIPPSFSVCSNESALGIRCSTYWSFSFSISPSNEHPGLISFSMDGLDLLAIKGTLKSLLQHHSSKASILQHSAFCTVQLSHPYTTTGKTVALTR